MTPNGVLSSHDLTCIILSSVVNLYSNEEDKRESCFVVLRSVCKMWRQTSDSFFKFYRDDALLTSLRRGLYESLRFLIPFIQVYPSHIIVASQNGYTSSLPQLLKMSFVDPSAERNLAIRWAAQRGHTDTVRILLEDPRVDPSADDNFAIKKACQNGHIDTVSIVM